MVYYKRFNNGLKLVVNKTEGFLSVSSGILVKTGSINENETENGISHFIEHTVFKGTKKRSAFDISDGIDRIGAQINAFTSKEMTCYYTKSTSETFYECMDILSDLFFESVFDKDELDRERGVIIEEINMSEDTPEDVCGDVLARAYYGKDGLGQTILGPAENIKKFDKKMVRAYMDKYYTADNVVISISGNVEIDEAVKVVETLFADRFTRLKSVPQAKIILPSPTDEFKTKKIEQTHIACAMAGVDVLDEHSDALNIANMVLGGGMSSRLFQSIREKMGLAYSVYSYFSQYKNCGTLEIYAGVNTASRDAAFNAVMEELKKFKRDGVTEAEFVRGKEQLRSAFIFGRESTAALMLLYGRYLLYYDMEFDLNDRMQKLGGVTLSDVARAVELYFDVDKMATATVGVKRTPLARGNKTR